ncbi:MAG: YggS family pyridoxal phosphate-dependent enzyme [Flavobacteriales bacterium]|nr:YggS family pyridoxal phosphate-dependent enzyme [Flavobacteriales bacterium]
MNITANLQQIKSTIPAKVTLVAVSKTYPNTSILQAYEVGQRVFGENKVQELVEKYESLPKDIEWHMIGHLQSNKVKYIAPFVKLIHGVDSLKLLQEINKRAEQNHRIIDCLLQVHIAQEETKFGFDENEVIELLKSDEIKTLKNINVIGLMGMATNTENETLVRNEFKNLKQLFDKLAAFNLQLSTLSMGMSNDYKIAIEEGSTMIRVGSSIFGSRNYH